MILNETQTKIMHCLIELELLMAVMIYVQSDSLMSIRPCCHGLMYTECPCTNANKTDPCTFIEYNE